MFDFKEDIYLVYNDGTIRGTCPECKKAQLVYASDNSTSVKCRTCGYNASWVTFSETLSIPKLVWVYEGAQGYLKEMNKDSLFLDGTCIIEGEYERKATWEPIAF